MKELDANPPESPPMIMRLWPHHHNDPSLRDETLEMLKAHRGICNEVWFCSELGTPTLDAHEKAALRMGEAAVLFREAGIKASIQIANTMGHASLFLEAVGVPWQRIVGHDGTTSKVVHCPHEPDYLQYLHSMATAYARWQPSALWIDDDLRMCSHFPVEYGCFCPRCIGRFSESQNREWTRENLVRSLKSPGGDLRQQWVEFGHESLAGIASVIAKAVQAVAPRCSFGLQHIGADWNLYNGRDWKTVFRAFREASAMPMGSRPGGGYYADHEPRGVLGKALDMARQVRALPEDIGTVCPEIENYIHNSMGKTAHGTAIESAWYLAQSNCNSLSYALFCSAHEDSAFYGSQLSVLEKWAPFYNRYLRENKGTSPGGFDPFMGYEHLKRPTLEMEGPMAWAASSFAKSYGLATLSLPLCPDGPTSCGVVLSAEAARGLTETEARRILSGGAILHGQALNVLNQRGWSEWAGAAASPFGPEEFFFERFTASPLNGTHSGKVWRQFRYGTTSPDTFRIECFQPDADVAGEYFDPTSGDIKGIATLAVETPLGGRLAVLGFNGFETNVSSARRQQFLNLADWVSHHRLPVILETAAQVALVARVTETGALRSVLLMNLTIDQTPPLSLKLRNIDGNNITLHHPPGRPDMPLTARNSGHEWLVTLPPMEPWSLAYLNIS